MKPRNDVIFKEKGTQLRVLLQINEFFKTSEILQHLNRHVAMTVRNCGSLFTER